MRSSTRKELSPTGAHDRCFGKPPTTLLLACGLALATAPLGTATAQDAPAGAASRPVIFGASGGFSQMSGGVGYQVQASLESRPLLRRLSVRTDGMFADWGAAQLAAFTANAVLLPFPRLAVAPYLMAGGGAYNQFHFGAQPGWTVGAGLRMRTSGRIAVTLESRMHAYRDPRYTQIIGPNSLRTTEPYQYVWQPLSVGVRF